jgi:hypothetical protein
VIHGQGARGGMYNQAWHERLDKLEETGKITVEGVLRIREELIRVFKLEKFRHFKPPGK